MGDVTMLQLRGPRSIEERAELHILVSAFSSDQEEKHIYSLRCVLVSKYGSS